MLLVLPVPGNNRFFDTKRRADAFIHTDTQTHRHTHTGTHTHTHRHTHTLTHRHTHTYTHILAHRALATFQSILKSHQARINRNGGREDGRETTGWGRRKGRKEEEEVNR